MVIKVKRLTDIPGVSIEEIEHDEFKVFLPDGAKLRKHLGKFIVRMSNGDIYVADSMF